MLCKLNNFSSSGKKKNRFANFINFDWKFLVHQNPELHPDFKNGVTALLIDKTPELVKWTPATLEEVSQTSIESIFFSSTPPFDNPPLVNLPRLHPGNAYKSYPHAKFSLPSELEIQDVVTGNASGSGKYALTKEEVVKVLTRGRNGKIGVREKVEEVLNRRSTVGEGNTLNWRYEM